MTSLSLIENNRRYSFPLSYDVLLHLVVFNPASFHRTSSAVNSVSSYIYVCCDSILSVNSWRLKFKPSSRDRTCSSSIRMTSIRRDLIHPSLGVNVTLMNAAKLRGELDSAGISVCEDLAACAFVSIDCQSISSWCACGAIELSYNPCDCLFGTGTESRMSSSYGCGLYGGSN